MKLAVTFAVLAIAGCAGAIDQDTSTADQAAVVPTGLPSTNTSCLWQVDQSCYGQLNDGNNLWPTGMGITSAYMMMRSGPTRLSGRQQTFLAFVVWNDTVVGRIFRVDIGTSNASNFLSVSASTFAGRTLAVSPGLPDPSAGSTGSTGGGGPPPPHPNVENPLVFDSAYLGIVANDAASVRRATVDFMAAKAPFD
jgi:hypothetical protein